MFFCSWFNLSWLRLFVVFCMIDVVGIWIIGYVVIGLKIDVVLFVVDIGLVVMIKGVI